ncbi:hypothetical protein HWV62_6833 [Athelia sp. TMB]|nr:hypothetical protein HWV62_6833 [Athelia sp. TMB]
MHALRLDITNSRNGVACFLVRHKEAARAGGPKVFRIHPLPVTQHAGPPRGTTPTALQPLLSPAPTPAPSTYTMTATATATDPLEASLEKIFQKLERESERRAQAELEAQDGMQHGVQDSEVPAPRRGSLLAANDDEAAARGRDRRRGSIVISVFGQPAERADSPASARVSPLAAKSAFYHARANASVDTLPVDGDGDGEGSGEDEQHVTTTSMHAIAGRASGLDKVGALLSRSRSRAHTLSTPTELVIGVCVVEATGADLGVERSATVSVCADGARGRSGSGAAARVKDSLAGLAHRFSRRNSASDIRAP